MYYPAAIITNLLCVTLWYLCICSLAWETYTPLDPLFPPLGRSKIHLHTAMTKSDYGFLCVKALCASVSHNSYN